MYRLTVPVRVGGSKDRASPLPSYRQPSSVVILVAHFCTPPPITGITWGALPTHSAGKTHSTSPAHLGLQKDLPIIYGATKVQRPSAHCWGHGLAGHHQGFNTPTTSREACVLVGAKWYQILRTTHRSTAYHGCFIDLWGIGSPGPLSQQTSVPSAVAEQTGLDLVDTHLNFLRETGVRGL